MKQIIKNPLNCGSGAATFGWLCVETATDAQIPYVGMGSYLRVAVC